MNPTYTWSYERRREMTVCDICGSHVVDTSKHNDWHKDEPAPEPVETPQAVDPVRELEQAVFEAIGAASMCWEDPPTGVFREDLAVVIGEKLLKAISRYEHRQSEEQDLGREIANVLNKYSMENGSRTPDFVLSEFVVDCIAVFDKAVNQRHQWYGGGKREEM
jgi:hypothetical protein